MKIYVVKEGEIEVTTLVEKKDWDYIVCDKNGFNFPVKMGDKGDLYMNHIDAYYIKVAFDDRRLTIGYANEQITILKKYYYEEFEKLKLEIMKDLLPTEVLKIKDIINEIKYNKEVSELKYLDEISDMELENLNLPKLRKLEKDKSEFIDLVNGKCEKIINFDHRVIGYF